MAWVQAYLHSAGRHGEEYFLIATLFDLNRHAAGNSDLGETMRHVAQNSSDSFERRFLVLLDAQFDRQYDALDGSKAGGSELAYRLGQMVKLAASKKIGICWPVLLADLCCWELTGKPVQKKWARNFYAPHFDADNESAADENLRAPVEPTA